MDTVDWYHLGIALTAIFKRSKSDFSRFVKFMNSMSNTGVQKRRFTEKSKISVTISDKCPCCKNESENNMHIFRCTHDEIQKANTYPIETLFTSLQKFKLPLDMWLTIRREWATSLVVIIMHLPQQQETATIPSNKLTMIKQPLDGAIFSRVALQTAGVT